MAPEQARGQQDEIGPSTDIFSLGCVLYECLAGQPPFFGEETAAVLAKILFEEVPPIRLRWPQVPPQIESLVMRMLAKDPHRRPADAAALLEELAALDSLSTGTLVHMAVAGAVSPPQGAPAIAYKEQLLVSVVVAKQAAASWSGDVLDGGSSFPASHADCGALRGALSGLGAYCELLADGSLVAALMQTGSATDQVAQAARCALAIHERLPAACCALATGRGVLNERLPVGEAIDRAVRLIRPAVAAVGQGAAELRPGFEGVWLDEVSARLLDARFTVTSTGLGLLLQGECLAADESRPLLGKPTPCVGREQELGTLEAALTSCIEESAARAVLVTAPPGMGKSRLRHEFLRRLQVQQLGLEILLGRGEPMSSGSPYAALSQALRRLCGIQSGEPPSEQRAKLRRRLGRHVTPADAQRIEEFLGELCHLPFPEDASVKLRAARSDPKIMRDQIGQAFLGWLAAECRHHPVLLILEDLHWGDLLTTRLLDHALRELQDQPFLVLALARPEVLQLFPELWEERRVQKLRLGPLPRRVCERLVLQILGRAVRPAIVARVVEQAAGNALYLEELVRAVAEGKGDAMPETVLAMLQARISRLDPGSRRVLRCASLFGTSFWKGSVRALYGARRASDDIDLWLHQLVTAEIIEQRPESRFPGEIEFAFRHSLMRDAAYSLLTEQDRVLGHRLAATYLQELGETDAMVIAEHLRCGDDSQRAIPHYIRAAEQSYERNDSQGSLERAIRGVACGATGEALGRLRALQFLACYWRGEWRESTPLGLESLTLLPAGSFWWCTAMNCLLVVAANNNQAQTMQELVRLFAATKPTADAYRPYVAAASQLAILFCLLGVRSQAQLFLERMRDIVARLGHGCEQDAMVRGYLGFGEGGCAHFLLPDPWLVCSAAHDSVLGFQLAGDLRNLVLGQVLLGTAQAGLGDYEAAEATLQGNLGLAEQLGEPFLLGTTKAYLAGVLAAQAEPAKLEEACALAKASIEMNLSPNLSGFAHCFLAQALRQQGHLAAAETQARRSVEMLAMMPACRIVALINLTRVLLDLGRAAEACGVAAEGLQAIADLGGSGYSEVSSRLAAAEALHAAGDVAAAHAELGRAHAELELRASRIPEPKERERFLTRVRDNARTRELGRAWLGRE